MIKNNYGVYLFEILLLNIIKCFQVYDNQINILSLLETMRT